MGIEAQTKFETASLTSTLVILKIGDLKKQEYGYRFLFICL